MKYLFQFGILFIAVNLNAADQQLSVIGHCHHWDQDGQEQECYPVESMRRHENSPIAYSQESDEDILCDAALEAYAKTKTDRTPCIKRYLIEIIQSEKNSPLVNISHVSKNIVRIRSGDFPMDGTASTEYMYELLVKASQRALEEQEIALQKKQIEIDRKWSRAKSIICTVISSLITSGVTFAVSFTSK